jgi:DNA-binding transcriptional LysR family regulator
MLNEAARARAEVKAVAAGARGELAIGIAAMFADHIIDKAVAETCAASPDVALTVTQGFLEDLVEALRDGRLDIIFSNLSNMPLPDDVAVEPVLDIHAHVHAAPGHPLAGRPGLTKADLLDARWAVVDQPHMRDFLDQYFSVEGLPPPAFLVRTNSLNLIASLIARGGFIGILPDHVIARRAGPAQAVRLDAPGCPIVRRAGLITRAAMPPRPVVELFMNTLRDTCASHALNASQSPDL